MKTLLLLMLFPFCLLAQAPYRGGINDGHAMTETKGITVQSVYEEHAGIISYYPNPVNAGDLIRVNTDLKDSQELTLLSLDGKIISNQRVTGASYISTNGLSAGVYLAIMQTDKHRSVKKIIIK